jgi:hypothetical protein
MSPPAASVDTVSVYRVTADWGEGASNAGTPGGQGAPAQTGDATWGYRVYDTITWATAGGTYAVLASAETTVGFINSFATWSSAQLRTDVQGWLMQPNFNYGWIVIGDEANSQTARRFDSRENPTAANRPRLRVYYSVTP